MKQTWLVFLLFVVVVVFYYVNKASVANSLSFVTGTPRRVSLRGGNVSFILPLNARNVTRGNISVSSADFTVSVGGEYAGKAFLTDRVIIQANSVTELPVLVEIAFMDLLPLFPQLKNKFPEMYNKGMLPFSVSGFIIAEGLRVPYEKVINVPIPAF